MAKRIILPPAQLTVSDLQAMLSSLPSTAALHLRDDVGKGTELVAELADGELKVLASAPYLRKAPKGLRRAGRVL